MRQLVATEPINSSLYIAANEALAAGVSAEAMLEHRSFLLSDFWANVDAFFADIPLEPETYPKAYDNAVEQIEGFLRSHLIALGALPPQ
jgi:hypothetical protein